MYITDGTADLCLDDVSYTGNDAGLRTAGSALTGVQTFTASFLNGYNLSNGCRLLPGVTYYLVLELEDVVAGTSQPETYIEGSTSDVYSGGSLTQGETGNLVDAWFSVVTIDSVPPPSPFPVSSTILYEYTASFSHAWSGTTVAFEPATPGTLGSFSHLGFTNNLSAPLSFQLYSQHPVTDVLISKDCVTDSKTAGEWGYTTDHPVHPDVDITHIC